MTTKHPYALLIAASLLALSAAPAQAGEGLTSKKESLEIRKNENEIEKNKGDVAEDKAALKQGKRERRSDRIDVVKEELKNNDAAADAKRDEITADNKRVRADERRLRKNKDELAKDRDDLAKDQRDKRDADAKDKI